MLASIFKKDHRLMAVRSRLRSRRTHLFEPLEPRQLLAVTTVEWDGGGLADNSWGNNLNWSTDVVANNTLTDEYVAIFRPSEAGNNFTVKVDQDFTVAGIVLEGGVTLTLVFDAAVGQPRKLKLTPAGGAGLPLGAKGQIVFQQAANATTTLTLRCARQNDGILDARSLDVIGDENGKSKLTVSANVQAKFAADVTAEKRVFDVDVTAEGSLFAENFSFMSKDTTANGTSTINIFGWLKAENWLRIGGNGKTALNCTNLVQAKNLWVVQESEMVISGEGSAFRGDTSATLSKLSALAPVTPATWPPNTITGGKGASLTIQDYASFTLSDISSVFLMNEGDGTSLTLKTIATMNVGEFRLGPGEIGKDGPKALLQRSSTIKVRKDFFCGGDKDRKAGTLEINKFSGVFVDGTAYIESQTRQAASEIKILDASRFAADVLQIGTGRNGGFAEVTVDGLDSVLASNSATTPMVVGSGKVGDRAAVILSKKARVLTRSSIIDKKVAGTLGSVTGGKLLSGEVTGDGTIELNPISGSPTVKSAGRGADIVIEYGDGVFEDMYVQGDLDAQQGTTIRATIGIATGIKASLYVHGDAILAPVNATDESVAELIVSAPGVDTSLYTPGTTFTVLHADGTNPGDPAYPALTGIFNNLPAGDYWNPHPDLPTLSNPPGKYRGWRVTYTDHDVILTVIEFSKVAYAQGRIGIVGSGDFEMDMGLPNAPARVSKSFSSAQEWQNGVPKSFELSRNASTGEFTWIIGTKDGSGNWIASQTASITWTPVLSAFDDIILRNFANPIGSSISIYNLALDGEALGITNTATGSGLKSSVLTLGDVDSGFLLTGDVVMNWTGARPTRSNLAFQIDFGNIAA